MSKSSIGNFKHVQVSSGKFNQDEFGQVQTSSDKFKHILTIEIT